nr:unknown function [Klebsiella phage vB_Kpn_K82P1]
MLQRTEILKALSERYISPEGVRVRVIDYTGNPLAPEKVAYRITFTSLGQKRKVTYWPNTVGFQS